MISTQKDGQPRGLQLPVHRGMQLPAPGRNFAQIPITVDPLKSGVGRPADVAAIDHLEAAGRQCRMQAGDAQRLGAHRGAAIARADIGGRADETRNARTRGTAVGRDGGAHAENTRERDLASTPGASSCPRSRRARVPPSFSSP